jgi:hypothetical protein
MKMMFVLVLRPENCFGRIVTYGELALSCFTCHIWYASIKGGRERELS